MTNPFLLGYLINEDGREFCTVYEMGSIFDYTDFNNGDVWDQEREMTREDFQKLVEEGSARPVKFNHINRK